MFDRYGRTTGYGQIAPGRDLPNDDPQGQPGRPRKPGPDLQSAIMGAGPAVSDTFQGAKQTTQVEPKKVELGAPLGAPATSTQPSAIDGLAPQGTPPATAPKPSFQTNLMEGDPFKLDPKNGHQQESPKYSFLQLANQNKYNYDQMPDMLKELQGGPEGKFWQGWQADGKGNFVFGGDPSQLDPAWKGVKRVDAVGAYGDFANGGQAKGWRWGVDDPNAPAMNPALMQNAIMGNQQQQPTTDAAGGDYAAKLRQQIMQALQVNPQFAQMAKTYGN